MGSRDQPKRELSSTYFVQDCSNRDEMARLRTDNPLRLSGLESTWRHSARTTARDCSYAGWRAVRDGQPRGIVRTREAGKINFPQFS